MFASGINWQEITVTLKEWNGNFGVGLAAGTDKSLPTSDRLQILPKNVPNERRALAAQVWAMKWMDEEGSIRTTWSDTLKRVVICAAGAVVRFGLVGRGGTTKDHDGDVEWLPENSNAAAGYTQDDLKKAVGFLTEKDIANALTLIFATKINFWTSNHHTGQDMRQLSGFPKKVYEAQYKSLDGNTDHVSELLT